MAVKAKYDKTVYRALSNAGMSNREIARILNVNESSVRRAVKSATSSTERRFMVTVTEL